MEKKQFWVMISWIEDPSITEEMWRRQSLIQAEMTLNLTEFNIAIKRFYRIPV